MTVTVASPALYAVTSPLSSTDATASLLLDHVTFRFVALWGVTVVVSTSLPPTGSVRLDLFRLTPVTEVTGGGGTAAAVTFICTDAVFAPSTVVTVTVASPALWAFTSPLALTDAISALLLTHVIFLFVALSGVITAVRRFTSFTFKSWFPSRMATLSTGVCLFSYGSTVTSTDPLGKPPSRSSDHAVTVVFPTLFAIR